jgi:hypothetical protein
VRAGGFPEVQEQRRIQMAKKILKKAKKLEATKPLRSGRK